MTCPILGHTLAAGPLFLFVEKSVVSFLFSKCTRLSCISGCHAQWVSCCHTSGCPLVAVAALTTTKLVFTRSHVDGRNNDTPDMDDDLVSIPRLVSRSDRPGRDICNRSRCLVADDDVCRGSEVGV